MNEQLKKSTSDSIIREDFKQKLKIWFEDRGIRNQLELFLRSQLMIKLQRDYDHQFNIVSNSQISPKIQAVKLLVADFLLQEDLLFSLSVFCSEVPFLCNLTHFTKYVSSLTESQGIILVKLRKEKPKFSRKDVCEILEALHLRLNREQIHLLCTKYERSKSGSLLLCLLKMLPFLMKKRISRILSNTIKKEKYFSKLIKTEKSKTKHMYSILIEAHDIVRKRKQQMQELVDKEKEIEQKLAIVETKLREMSTKEEKLEIRETTLKLKENEFNNKRRSILCEFDVKQKLLQEKDGELQCKYKMLEHERARLTAENEHFEKKRASLAAELEYNEMLLKKRSAEIESREESKLRKYDEKFQLLQDQVTNMLSTFNVAQPRPSMTSQALISRDIQCTSDTLNQSQQTESDVATNVEEYVKLIEKENTLLRLNANKQRYHITQLTGEVFFLKNKLECVPNKVKMKQEFQRGNELNQTAYRLQFPQNCNILEVKSSHQIPLTEKQSQFKRKLLDDALRTSPDESSSSVSKTSNLTDEIVAQAKKKLNQLETESAALNRNFEQLQCVINRNIIFGDKILNSSFSDSSSTDRSSRRCVTLNSSNSSPEYKSDCRSFSIKNAPCIERRNYERKGSFKRQKYKSIQISNPVEIQLALSSVDEKACISEIKEKPELVLDTKIEAINDSVKRSIKNDTSAGNGDCDHEDDKLVVEQKSIEIDEVILPRESSSIQESSQSSSKSEAVISAHSSDSKNSFSFWK